MSQSRPSDKFISAMRRALEQAHSCALSRRQILPGQCLHDEVREGEYVVWIYAEPIGIDDAHDAHIGVGVNLVLEAIRQRLAVAAASRGVGRDHTETVNRVIQALCKKVVLAFPI